MRRGKKRIAAGMVMACVMAASVLPAYAAENNKLTVGYEKGVTYTLSIPTTAVALKEDVETEAVIGVSEINVGTKQSVEIRVASGIADGNVTLTDKNDATNTATAKVSLTANNTGNGITTGDTGTVVGKFKGTSTEALDGTGKLYFSKLVSTDSTLASVPAGSYSGTITFTAKLAETN